MNEIIEFLNANPVQFLATVGLDNKPKVRPFQFMIEENGRLYFCTNNEKDVFKEMQKNAFVEITACSQNYSWIRLEGKVIFDDNMEIKNKIIEHSPLVKNLYKTGDNPIFEIFYLENGKAVIADFSGNPPKEYNL